MATPLHSLAPGVAAVLFGATALLAQDAPGKGRAAATGAAPSIAGQQQYWFGVAVQNLPPAIARQLKLKPDQGLMVLDILPDSPAARAQLRPEDILIEIDNVALTSYEELARAANRRPPSPSRANTDADAAKPDTAENKLTAALLPVSCQLTILREGDRKTLTVIPAVRPANLQANGANLTNFTVGGAARTPRAPAGAGSQMIVLPNGTTAQVGPGFPVDLSGPDASTVSMRRMVARGETVTLTQELDAAGATRHRLTVGNRSYTVEPGKIDALPEELRPIARQMLSTMTHPAKTEVPQPPAPPPSLTPPLTSATLESRLQELEKQNAALRAQNEATQKRLERVIELLEKNAEK